MKANAKTFIRALELCRKERHSGVIWKTDLPKQIVDLFEIDEEKAEKGIIVAGIHVIVRKEDAEERNAPAQV